MYHVLRLCLTLFFITLMLWGVHADGNTSLNSSVNNTLPPNIFMFSKANSLPVGTDQIKIEKTDKYETEDSIESYYNNMSTEADTSLPRLVFDGIPIECHFCKK